MLVCFFFFQAEDGIRDGHVTGVQTCALPIFPRRLLGFWLTAKHGSEGLREVLTERFQETMVGDLKHRVLVPAEIGRASCRERGEMWGGGRAMKEKVERLKRPARRGREGVVVE